MCCTIDYNELKDAKQTTCCWWVFVVTEFTTVISCKNSARCNWDLVLTELLRKGTLCIISVSSSTLSDVPSPNRLRGLQPQLK